VAQHGGRTGAGSTVPGNDTSQFSQHPHSVGDGRTAPGPDSRVASRNQRGEDSPFDPGARGMTGHLMLRSGGVGEVPRAEGNP
jgi:hypothetical protein